MNKFTSLAVKEALQRHASPLDSSFVDPGSLDLRSEDEGTLTTIPVLIPTREQLHDIVVGRDVLGVLKEYLTNLKLSRVALIVSSPTINELHGDRVASALKDAGCESVFFALFPDGEENKNIEWWLHLLGVVHELEEKAHARLLIVNVGGGVVGDVGAYVAACYARGRDYIQIPTTLLGQVDCGIGGKCAVNFKGKNLVGVFHQPRLVVADLNFLKTLPKREIRSGLAEIIKYGVILDPLLFGDVEANLDAILSCDLSVLEPIVVRCFRLKVEVVQQDEKDVKGIRAKLNFGHTIGHAIEAATDYKIYSHGEAISIGMVCACEIAERLGMIQSDLTRRVELLFRRADLPVKMSAELGRVMEAMQHDKKFTDGVNQFVLPTALGNVKMVGNIDVALIRKVVEDRIKV